MLLIDQLLWLPLVTYCWSSVGLPQDRRWLNIYQVFIERLSNIWSNHFEGHFAGDYSKFFLAFIDTFFKRQEILMNEGDIATRNHIHHIISVRWFVFN